jgi:hypothetical protein
VKRLFIAGLALLAACADDPAPRQAPSASASAPQASAPAQRMGPVTQFDGRYAGPITPVTGAFTCTDRLSGERTMTVTQGRVSMDMAPRRGSPLRGSVQEDGTLRAADMIDRSNAVEGQIVDQEFVGTWHNGRCNYQVTMHKQ